jgi:hypothetical protein
MLKWDHSAAEDGRNMDDMDESDKSTLAPVLE